MMSFTQQLRRLAFVMLTGVAIALGTLSVSITVASLTPAAAQISEDAQIALEQYGMWRPHPRFGQVWVPREVPPDWRPYQYGHWVYTDEWGWYWASDDVEADWGWVVFHYGRWAFERGFGWFWVPGDEWAPAWVNWRYGDDYSGWAPLPPDELIETYEVEPAYWVFVPTRFIAAPRLRTYYVPVYRRSVILRETRIVNRTFGVRGARLAVNPGISPAFVARVSGAPVATYHVRPRVFATTQGVAGAVPIRREELRAARGGRPPGPGGPGARQGGSTARLGAVSIQRTTTVIQPSATITAPQPLNKNEPGRLGTHPPRAAQGAAPSLAPAQQQPSPSTTPSPGSQPQTPTIQQQAPSGAPPGAPKPPQPAPPATTTAPTTTAPVQREERREERRERSGPGGPPGGPPPQPNIVRPVPPQASPPPPPPQERRASPPPPQEQRRAPPPPPPPQQQPPPPKAPAAPAVRPPPPPPPAGKPAPPAAPAKKPPPKPGEKTEEKK